MSNKYYLYVDEKGNSYYINTVTGARKNRLSSNDIEVSEIDDYED